MINKIKIWSFFIFLVFAATIIYLNISNPPKNILTYDVFGYYLYLPGTFIYHQWEYTDQSTFEKINDKYEVTSTFYQFVRAPNLKYLNKYSMGLAFLYLPFFLIAHLMAIAGGFPADGFSPPYQLSLLVGGLIYSFIGIFVLRKVLLKYLSDVTVAITMALLIFGSNYIYEATFKGIMPHNLIFTLYTLILWFTIRWHEEYKMRDAILLGFFCGLAILSRPTEIICLLIPLLWGVTDKNSLKEKFLLLRKNYRQVIAAGVAIFLIWIPQMIYWKAIAGSFLFYSYDNPGEGFEFLWPYTLKVLFSFRKGWLVYSPVMAFAIIGLYYLRKYNRQSFIPVLSFFILNLYLVSSWSCWWYAESYGQRALIQSYAVMALPFGYFTSHILHHRSWWLKLSVLLISLSFIVLNFFQIWQLQSGILDASRMTRNFYFSIFGKTHVTEDQRKLLSVRRPFTSREYLTDEQNFNRSGIAVFDFEKHESSREKYYDSLVVHSGKFSLRMDSTWLFSPEYKIRFKDLTKKEYAWIRASAYIYPTGNINSEDILLVVTFAHRGGYYKYRAVRLSSDEFHAIPNQWNFITMDYITPEVRSKNDMLSIYVWYQGKSNIYVDDLSVEMFEPGK